MPTSARSTSSSPPPTAQGGALATAFSCTSRLNDAPTLNHKTPDQVASVGAAYTFSLPTDAFLDDDPLNYSAQLQTGAALPAWLTFNGATRTFSGTPASSDQGTYAIEVTAKDSANLSASDLFELSVNTQSGLTLHYQADSKWSGGYYAYNAGSPGHPGSGHTAVLDGENRSYGVFEGGHGIDLLKGTSGNDALFLDDRYSPFPAGQRGPRPHRDRAHRDGQRQRHRRPYQ